MTHQIESFGAVRSDTELAVFRRIQDRQGIMEQMLRHRDLRHLGVHPHGLFVDDFDRVGIPQGRRVIVHHVALHQTQNRRTGFRIQYVLQVPCDIFCGQRLAVMPVDVVADVKGPSPQIVARLPIRQQMGPRDVVVAGLGQIADDLTRDIRIKSPRKRMRAADLDNPHGDAYRAAFRQILGKRLGREVLAGKFAGKRIGGRRGHAEQRRIPDELAPVEPALSQLLFKLCVVRMMVI